MLLLRAGFRGSVSAGPSAFLLLRHFGDHWPSLWVQVAVSGLAAARCQVEVRGSPGVDDLIGSAAVLSGLGLVWFGRVQVMLLDL